jgi:hydrogenase maturation factor HypE
MSPHGVLSAAMGAGNDLAYQRMSRIAGDYQPGQMEQMSDQLDQGDNDNTN